MNDNQIRDFLSELDDCVKLCKCGDDQPIRQLVATLAFELGKRTGTIEKFQNLLSDAIQADLEHGVKWLNDRASKEFHATYPELSAAISDINRHENT